MAANPGPFPIEAEAFLREHDHDLRRVVRGHLAPVAWLGDPDAACDDIMQEVRLAVVRNWDSFDPARSPRLKWARGIARHKTQDHVRGMLSERAPRELPIDRLLRVLFERSAVEGAEDDALRRALEECLYEQPEPDRRFAIEYQAQKRQAHSRYSAAERQRMSRISARIIDCAESSLPDF